jgi:nitrite reductase/ring-hydroxylating ferredoxin subunit
MDITDLSCPDRRCVLTAAAVGAAAVLTGCSSYGDTSTETASAAAPSSGAAAGASGAGGGALAALADVPVGGGKILADRKIVLTQPTAGTVKAFSAVCTHAGCVVGEVSGGTINCPCHGSKFKVEDGAVANGPAAKPLTPVPVSVQNGQIVQG